MNTKQFAARHKVRIAVEWADTNPNFDANAADLRAMCHFKCVLKIGRKQFTVPFSQGCAHTREPTAADVLDCLASDAAGFDNARHFEDWCAEYGYDSDSRRAERIFETVKAQAAKLETFLGADLYRALLFDTERL